jgi:hypothetical protein
MTAWVGFWLKEAPCRYIGGHCNTHGGDKMKLLIPKGGVSHGLVGQVEPLIQS